MSTPLLQTKLHVPQPRPHLVSRPRLVERLKEGLLAGRKLALVSAPAGFGKTTLVTEWAASLPSVWDLLRDADRPCAWLSLDEGDNDPVRFLAYLVAALQGVDSNIGRSVQAMLQSPQSPLPEALLTSLINDIAAASQPFALVLDDYHLIQTLPIHQQLAFLLDHQPSQMHLVIAQRGRHNYSTAATYLTRVRDLYRRLDEPSTWERLIVEVRESNPRLRALRDELNKAGL